jgi:hypothetical protein
MDCNHARLLLKFVRPDGTELEASEAEALQDHLSQCADCGALAGDERRLDEAFAQAMRQVPVPGGLRERILSRLTARRQKMLKRWLAAAAALLLLVGGLAGWTLWQPRPYVNVDEPAPYLIAARSPATVEEAFEKMGVVMTAPTQFDYALLESFELADFQGRKVPKLLFVAPKDQLVAHVAHVYVLSERQFNTEDTPASTGYRDRHQIRVFPGPGFVYLVIYTGGSLDPFLIPEEQGV